MYIYIYTGCPKKCIHIYFQIMFSEYTFWGGYHIYIYIYIYIYMYVCVCATANKYPYIGHP